MIRANMSQDSLHMDGLHVGSLHVDCLYTSAAAAAYTLEVPLCGWTSKHTTRSPTANRSPATGCPPPAAR